LVAGGRSYELSGRPSGATPSPMTPGPARGPRPIDSRESPSPCSKSERLSWWWRREGVLQGRPCSQRASARSEEWRRHSEWRSGETELPTRRCRRARPLPRPCTRASRADPSEAHQHLRGKSGVAQYDAMRCDAMRCDTPASTRVDWLLALLRRAGCCGGGHTSPTGTGPIEPRPRVGVALERR
jgi:hypothetical protein